MPNVSFPPATFLADFKSDRGADWTLLVFSNLSMFGQDLVSVLLGLYSNTTLIPQGWSLSLELWFYLLVPILWRASGPTFWMIVAPRATLRVRIVVSPLGFFSCPPRVFPVV